MIALAPWQGLLNGVGWVVAKIYDVIPNYGLTIIALTILIRVVLLPLGIRQIRSMQHMQIIQPKVKQIQTKYKGNKQRQQEEIMKLYKEYGVNPFSGCWPVLLQFPILISMYSVVRFPQHPIHIPVGSDLYAAVTQQVPTLDQLGVPPTATAAQAQAAIPKEGRPPTGTSFLTMNLLCSASNAGNQNAKLGDRATLQGETVTLEYPVDCGNSVSDRIPYYIFAALMFGTTFYQQRQMQNASPPGAASGQQQALLKFMPLMFGVFGIFFPAGLVIYWTTSNAWQIGQQYFMLKSRPTAESLAAKADGKGAREPKKGFMASMMERAESERAKRGTTVKPPSAGTRKAGTPKPGSTGTPKPGSSRTNPKKPGSSGGTDGGSPKKRPKR
jgi:YidC/Oxa1 family membrane protein insertase